MYSWENNSDRSPIPDSDKPDTHCFLISDIYLRECSLELEEFGTGILAHVDRRMRVV